MIINEENFDFENTDELFGMSKLEPVFMRPKINNIKFIDTINY